MTPSLPDRSADPAARLLVEPPEDRYGGACMADAVSVIVPAHNEARVIGRLLARLAPAAGPAG